MNNELPSDVIEERRVREHYETGDTGYLKRTARVAALLRAGNEYSPLTAEEIDGKWRYYLARTVARDEAGITLHRLSPMDGLEDRCRQVCRVLDKLNREVLATDSEARRLLWSPLVDNF